MFSTHSFHRPGTREQAGARLQAGPKYYPHRSSQLTADETFGSRPVGLEQDGTTTARSSTVAFGWHYYVIDCLHRKEGRGLGLDLDAVPLRGGTRAGLLGVTQPGLKRCSVGSYFGDGLPRESEDPNWGPWIRGLALELSPSALSWLPTRTLIRRREVGVNVSTALNRALLCPSPFVTPRSRRSFCFEARRRDFFPPHGLLGDPRGFINSISMGFCTSVPTQSPLSSNLRLF